MAYGKKGVVLLDNSGLQWQRFGLNNLIRFNTGVISLFQKRYQTFDEICPDRFLYETVLGESPEQFNILLAHNPAYFKEYVSWGADLILSGHVHGGVIRIPFFGGVFSPEKIFFPEYDAGLFESRDSIMVVNRGLGYSKVNLRLFNRPEISFIELKSN